jgi:hypothetical protein
MAKNKMSYEALEKRMADVGFPAGTPENAEAVKQYRASAGIATKCHNRKVWPHMTFLLQWVRGARMNRVVHQVFRIKARQEQLLVQSTRKH